MGDGHQGKRANAYHTHHRDRAVRLLSDGRRAHVKASRRGVHGRRPLAEAPHILHADEPRGARRQDRRSAKSPGTAPGRAGAPLPARRDHQVRRSPGGLLQAVPARRLPGGSRVHNLLRRPLHGRDRRHPERSAPERHTAQPDGRLLDGRHGADRRRHGLLGRPLRPPRRAKPSHRSPT